RLPCPSRRRLEELVHPCQSREHPALDGADRLPQPFRELRLGEPAEVGELERLALRIRQLPERCLYPLALEPKPGDVRRRAFRVRGLELGQRLGTTALLAPDEV